nr:hypothetical protein [Tanacetum cinerariifolium]
MEILLEPTSNKLLVGSIHIDQRGTVVLATLFNGSEQRHFGIPTVAAAGQKGRQFTTLCPLFKLIIDDSKKTYNTASATL